MAENDVIKLKQSTLLQECVKVTLIQESLTTLPSTECEEPRKEGVTNKRKIPSFKTILYTFTLYLAVIEVVREFFFKK